VINVSEDAYLGDAQFTVSVDGTALAGVFTAKASHGAGQTEAFTVAPSLSAGTHQVAISFINDAYAGSASTDRNLYLDGASYNGAAISGAAAAILSNGTDTFAATTGGGGLVINVAEDAFQGDAQFTATVDGQSVGGVYTVTASRAAGEVQAITLANVLPNGQHTVGISFINDAYGNSPSTDRNLYVTGATYNGTSVGNVAASLYVDTTDTMVFAASPDQHSAGLSSTVTLFVSEDAYQGDAQFTVAVDGLQYGGIFTATASHAAGQSQTIAITGVPEQFSAHDIAVSFLNDAYLNSPSTDRNLYVDAIQLDGKSVPNGSAALYVDRTQHFAASVSSDYVG
ncbi:MAG: carbohydrate-binding domain-containing protein, partial [Janthinobacterium lividum]